MKRETEIWLSIAEEDYHYMEIMVREKSLRPAVFFAQQAVEKILKGYVCELKNKTPRKTHFIEILVKDAGLNIKEVKSEDIKRLSVAYEWSRYKDLSTAHFKTADDIKQLIITAKTLYQWVKKKL